eukprot:3635737-Pyramimonas_sp.AAC.1
MSQSQKQDVVIQLRAPYPGLGMPGDYVEVRPGFARNFLVPHRVARLLDSKERKAWRAQQDGMQQETPTRSLERDVQLTLQQLPKVVQRLTTQTLVLKQMTAKDNPQLLTKPLTTEALSAAVKKQMKVVLAPESLLLGEPIRTLGEHSVPLYFDPLYVK